ncbi:MAG: redoxin domain-containing protein [Terriglobales bacterium]
MGRAGYRLAALSVDPPARAARLRQQLGLGFPLLCDVERKAVQDWGLYNAAQRGGIAVPASVVVDAGGRILLFAREEMMTRLRPRDVLAFVTRPQAIALQQRGFWPGGRAWLRAFFH